MNNNQQQTRQQESPFAQAWKALADLKALCLKVTRYQIEEKNLETVREIKTSFLQGSLSEYEATHSIKYETICIRSNFISWLIRSTRDLTQWVAALRNESIAKDLVEKVERSLEKFDELVNDAATKKNSRNWADIDLEALAYGHLAVLADLDFARNEQARRDAAAHRISAALASGKQVGERERGILLNFNRRQQEMAERSSAVERARREAIVAELPEI